jgi:hypothetical protein
VLCLMMRYDTIQLSVRRSRQAALDDAGVRGIPSPTPGRQDVDFTSLHFHMRTVGIQLHTLHSGKAYSSETLDNLHCSEFSYRTSSTQNEIPSCESHYGRPSALNGVSFCFIRSLCPPISLCCCCLLLSTVSHRLEECRAGVPVSSLILQVPKSSSVSLFCPGSIQASLSVVLLFCCCL